MVPHTADAQARVPALVKSRHLAAGKRSQNPQSRAEGKSDLPRHPAGRRNHSVEGGLARDFPLPQSFILDAGITLKSESARKKPAGLSVVISEAASLFGFRSSAWPSLKSSVTARLPAHRPNSYEKKSSDQTQLPGSSAGPPATSHRT
jgi:hypothetical protein